MAGTHTKMADDPAEFIETALFWAAKSRPTKKSDNDLWSLGALIRPNKEPGILKPQILTSKNDALPPNIRNVVDAWVCEGDAAFTNHAKPLELAPTKLNQRRTMIEEGLKTLGEHIPVISDRAGFASPPVSTAEHDNDMLYFERKYAGGIKAPPCAHGDENCVAALLSGAPGALPAYMSMSEHQAALECPIKARHIIEELGNYSLCLLCNRAEIKAIAFGSNNKIVNAGEQLRRFTAIRPNFTNLVNCAGGYFEEYIGVSPIKTPQICTACVVDGNPLRKNGEQIFTVAYNHFRDKNGDEKGLHVNQDEIIWKPGN